MVIQCIETENYLEVVILSGLAKPARNGGALTPSTDLMRR